MIFRYLVKVGANLDHMLRIFIYWRHGNEIRDWFPSLLHQVIAGVHDFEWIGIGNLVALELDANNGMPSYDPYGSLRSQALPGT